MTTTVKHEGKVRSWEGSIESWEAHSEVIQHWCDGGEVETGFKDEDSWSLTNYNPTFDGTIKYRIAQRTPKAGEV